MSGGGPSTFAYILPLEEEPVRVVDTGYDNQRSVLLETDEQRVTTIQVVKMDEVK